MSESALVWVRELVGWGLDENALRPPLEDLASRSESACRKVALRSTFQPEDACVPVVPVALQILLETQRHRVDLHAEMAGLDWSVGMVDLRLLLAFQRRLISDENFPHAAPPAQEDWPALVALTFAPPIPVHYELLSRNGDEILLQSENPNLQLRSSGAGLSPLELHGGSPFFEVATYRGRWFLRDGYHRAYRLLRAGVVQVPAVVIKARTLVELGPVEPWFFGEETLFGMVPPRLVDFLDDELTIEYKRPRMLKTLHVRVSASFAPRSKTLDTGEQA